MTTTNQQGMIAKKQSNTVAKKQPQGVYLSDVRRNREGIA